MTPVPITVFQSEEEMGRRVFVGGKREKTSDGEKIRPIPTRKEWIATNQRNKESILSDFKFIHLTLT